MLSQVSVTFVIQEGVAFLHWRYNYMAINLVNNFLTLSILLETEETRKTSQSYKYLKTDGYASVSVEKK